jgi:hypothetical protein
MLGLTPSVNGLQNSLAQFDQAANNFTRATEPTPTSGGQDSVDLSTAAVAVVQARNSFDANTKVVETMNEMTKTLINTIG